jgi:eukaryotic-like serine/threonine-protein kinase
MNGLPEECASSENDGSERGDRAIGDFRLVRTLGEGGMGIVYEAEQQHPRRPVALKVIRGEAHVSPDTLKLFQREIQTLARLSHPGIAQLFEAGVTDDGMHFFAMELVHGVTLSEWLRSRPKGAVTVAETRIRLGVFRKICDAVAYAHQKGVIHRDLKPANVLVQQPSADPSMPDSIPDVKVLDFGLARITDSDVQSTTFVTEMGKIRGTLPYMSPEQVRGNPDEIDLRTDVYSLGVMLYEMVAGRLPYDIVKAQVHEAARIICEEPPRTLSSALTGTRRLDVDVATIAVKCLEKEATRRYQSAAALGEDVQRFLADQPIFARPPNAAYQLRKLIVRHKRPFAAATAAFVLLALFAGAMTMQAIRIGKERDRVTLERDRANLEASVATSLSESFALATRRGSSQSATFAQDFVDDVADRISWKLRDQPLVHARTLLKIGLVCRQMGFDDRADALLRRSAALIESLYGKTSLEYADALSYLSEYADLGQADTIYARLLKPDDPRLVRVRYLLWELQIRRSFPGGDANLNRPLSVVESSQPREAMLQSWTLESQALVLLRRGDCDRAVELLRQTLAIDEQIYSKRQPQRMRALINLGSALMAAGALQEAKGYLETAVADSAHAFGSDDLIVAEASHNLGELERREGRFDLARPLLERSLVVFDNYAKQLTRDERSFFDPAVKATLTSLGRVDRSEGHLGEAVEHLRRACECKSPVSEPTDDPCPDYAQVLRATGH